MSQAELASKLGVTQQAVGKWESGKSSPDPTTVAKIAELLNTTADFLLGLTAAIPILLGDNIGTTITAVLAAIGQGRDAKRVAAAHAIFNLSGAAVCCILLQPFAALVRLCSPTGVECAVIARQIANAHTLFNGLCALVWLPLTGQMVRLVCALLPDKNRPKERL